MMDRTILDEMVHVDCLVPCTGSYKLLVWMDVWNGMVSGKIMFGWLYGPNFACTVHLHTPFATTNATR